MDDLDGRDVGQRCEEPVRETAVERVDLEELQTLEFAGEQLHDDEQADCSADVADERGQEVPVCADVVASGAVIAEKGGNKADPAVSEVEGEGGVGGVRVNSREDEQQLGEVDGAGVVAA